MSWNSDWPLKECLSCHTNAKAGELLGVIAIQHRLKTVTTEVRFYYVGLFLILGLLVLLAATTVSAFASRKIKRSVELFRSKVESVNSVKDFDLFDISRVDFGFEEFNQTFDDVALLVEKMKCVAVDKDILEFEIKLLEKFIITSNVVRDWREFIKKLLLDITRSSMHTPWSQFSALRKRPMNAKSSGAASHRIKQFSYLRKTCIDS
jgi:hypothetical protein